MNNKILCTGFLFFSFQCMVAQTVPSLPDHCLVFRPKTIKSTNKSTTLLKESNALQIAKAPYGQTTSEKQSATYWIVYSDRSNNPAYTTSSGQTICKKLSLGQKVTIAKIENGRALVYEDKIRDREYPALPFRNIEYECFGWVPMDHLLLWDSCPTDESGIYNKALLCVNIDAKDVGRLVKEAPYKYSSPEKGEKLPLTLDEKIYYIMKRSGDYVLLATQYTLESSSSRGVLVGWVKDISYVPWNHRACLEPTWDPESVDLFVQKKIKASVSERKGGAVSATWDFLESQKMKARNDKTFKGAAPNPYRLPGDIRRFPILESGNGLYKISSFSRSSATTDMTIESMYSKGEVEIKQLQNINLVLLIDGTQSMGPFYPAVRQGLLDGCRALGAIKDAKINVSAVIYRDRMDMKDGKSYEIEPFPSRWVQPADANLHTFLSKGGEYGIRSSSKDKTLEESLYAGIETALSYYNGKEKQSNILLIVGDCGNLPDETKKEALIKKARQLCVQIIGYQVQFDNAAGRVSSYTAYADQLSDIMSNSLKGIYNTMEKAGNAHFDKDFLRFKQNGNRFSLATIDNNKIYRGAVICPFDGGKMSSNELKDEMFSSIYSLSQAIQEQINIVVGSNISNVDDPFHYMVEEGFLATRGLKSTDVGKKTLSFLGWTKMKSSTGNDFYKPVLLLSRDELTTLVNELGQVNTRARAESEDRKPFIDAMTDLASKHAGGLSGQDLRTLSTDDIQGIIYGLPEKSGTLSKYTLEEIADPKKVSNSQFRDILNGFRRRYNQLKQIRNRADYQGRYEFNGASYYWIPIEDLP